MKVCPQCQREYAASVDFCAADGMKLRSKRTESEDPMLGKALEGRWVIEEKLGEGGMGAVYKGRQRSVSRTVAIKTLRPQLVDSEEFVDRFFREAKIAANIAHPHCVTILDYGESDDGTLYLAMEFLDGELLTDAITRDDLTVKQVIEIGIQVASALSAAHDQQIVHRDLKPDNIFLLDVPGGGPFAKVLDFGIAKMLDANTQVTRTGMIVGTPEYMSPEQCRGEDIDGRSDLYALGCILYELVGGRTPFQATTPMAVLMAHVNQEAPSLSADDTSRHIPTGLEQVIMRLLEKDPDRRYPDATAVREALEDELPRLDDPAAQVTRSGESVAPDPEIAFDETAELGALDEGELEARPPVRTTRRRPEAAGAKTSNRGLLLILALVVGSTFVVAVVAAGLLSDAESADGTERAVRPPVEGGSEGSAHVAATAPSEPAEQREPVELLEESPEPTANDEEDEEQTERAKQKREREKRKKEREKQKKEQEKRKRKKRAKQEKEQKEEVKADVKAGATNEPSPEPGLEQDQAEETEEIAGEDATEEQSDETREERRRRRLDKRINDAVEKRVKRTGKGIRHKLDDLLP